MSDKNVEAPESHPESKDTTEVPTTLTKNNNTEYNRNLERGLEEEPTLHSDKLEKDAELLGLNVVDWDGLDDPENPMNWPNYKAVGHVVIVSVITLTVNLAATMFAPGASELIQDFHITNSTVGSLTVTIYLLGFAIGPMFIAPLSELYGRLIIYHVCNAIFIAFMIGCALSKNTGMFFVFRFITGCAGSAPLTIGGGTIADVIKQEERGAALAIFAMGPLLGPVIGPVIGGFVAQALGWRWTFWILVIMSGVVSIITLILMRETYSPVLLKRKTTRLQKETGNLALVSKSDRGLSPRALFTLSIVRPIKLLLFSPIVLLLSLFAALVFGLMFLLFTTFPAVFEEQYGFSAGVSGLSYLGLGIGMIFGLLVFRVLSDTMLKKAALKGDGEMKPEYRLPLMVYLMPVLPIGFFWYGWSAYAKVHWIVPILGTSLIGVGSLFVVMPIQIYLVDAFGEYAASALAANTILRSLFGAFFPMVGPPMYKALGLGWGNSLLGFLSMAFAIVPVFFWRYGEQIRKKWVVKL